MQEKQVNQAQTRNNSKAVLHFIAILLTVVTIVSLAIGLFAWSKYTASLNGNANAAVAKWNFNIQLRQGKQNATATSGPIDMATTSFSHVENERIAPGTSGEFEIIVNTQGTEVSLQYDVNLELSNCPRNITFSKKGPGENSFTEISAGAATNNRTRTISFSKSLSLSDVTTANTNQTTFVETIHWDWPYELTGNDPSTNEPYTAQQKIDYDTRDNEDESFLNDTNPKKAVTIDITVTGTETMETASSGQEEDTGVGEAVQTAITTSDYGKYVDIGTTILSTYEQGVTLPTLKSYSYEDTEADYTVYADWRILHKDENGMYLILADNLPSSNSVISTVGLVAIANSGTGANDVGHDHTMSRKQFIDALNGDWSSLISGTALASKSGVLVKGAPDLATLIDSWNLTHASVKFYKSAAVATADGNGYNISDTNNPPLATEYTASVSENADTEANYSSFMSGLYTQYDEVAYWVANPSLSPNDNNLVLRMGGDYYVGFGEYDYQWGGSVRPVIFVPNAVKIDKTNSVYTIQ